MELVFFSVEYLETKWCKLWSRWEWCCFCCNHAVLFLWTSFLLGLHSVCAFCCVLAKGVGQGSFCSREVARVWSWALTSLKCLLQHKH